MKKILVAAALLIGGFFAMPAQAQVGVSLNLNIGSQPDWGPVGYDHVDYYYLPDVDAYYDVPAHRYVYMENNTWVRRTYLPARYRSYDVYNGYKVVINKPTPWTNHNYYRTTYVNYRGRAAQPIIRDSRDAKYKEHWKGDNGRHRGWDKGHGKGNGPGKGHGNGHGNGHGRGHGHH